MKNCTKCKALKPLIEFDRIRSNDEKRRSHCKLCRQAKTKQWRHNNPEKNIQHTLKYQRSNPKRAKEQSRKYEIKRKFGITQEQYNKMLEQQNSTCAVCLNVCPSGRQLAVDHNHDTGQIRGLLCCNCNLGLGQLKENIHIMVSMIEYIKKYSNIEPKNENIRERD